MSDTAKKKLLLLATGGTIACGDTADGRTPELTGEELLKAVPMLQDIAAIDCRQLWALDSSDVAPQHWTRLAAEVFAELANYDGFIITHGTDTMTYTAAALSFALVDCPKPVVLTGSQLPLKTPGSDAVDNLLLAACSAASELPGVFLAFGGRLIDGVRAAKLKTESFDAFDSINAPCVGMMKRDVMLLPPLPPAREYRPQLKNSFCPDVLLQPLTPGISLRVIDAAVANGYRGIVLQGFGSGNAPGHINAALQKAAEAGVVIIMCSQCRFEACNMDLYAVGQAAKNSGVISGGDMTAEAAWVRLSWALAQTEDAAEVRALLAQPLPVLRRK